MDEAIIEQSRATGKKPRSCLEAQPAVKYDLPAHFADLPDSTAPSEVGDASDPTLAILQELEQEDLLKETAAEERKLAKLTEEGEEEEQVESSEEEEVEEREQSDIDTLLCDDVDVDCWLLDVNRIGRQVWLE